MSNLNTDNPSAPVDAGKHLPRTCGSATRVSTARVGHVFRSVAVRVGACRGVAVEAAQRFAERLVAGVRRTAATKAVNPNPSSDAAPYQLKPRPRSHRSLHRQSHRNAAGRSRPRRCQEEVPMNREVSHLIETLLDARKLRIPYPTLLLVRDRSEHARGVAAEYAAKGVVLDPPPLGSGSCLIVSRDDAEVALCACAGKYGEAAADLLGRCCWWGRCAVVVEEELIQVHVLNGGPTAAVHLLKRD
jgi:hypothetical protein